MCWNGEQLLGCAKQLTVSNLKSIEQHSYLHLQMKARHLPSTMKKYLMSQIQSISLHQKPFRSENHMCSLVTAIAQKNLQAKGIPILLWSDLSTRRSSKVGLLSPFSEERKKQAQEFPESSRKTVRWQELDHKKSIRYPVFCCQYLWFYYQFSLHFFLLLPLPPHQIALHLQKTWLTCGFTDFKAKRNYCVIRALQSATPAASPWL